METEFNISNAELVVMRVIWSLGAARVDEIEQQLSPKLSWSLATVKTLLGRLVKKGMLSTQKEGRKFVYRPMMAECAAIGLMADDLLAKTCETKHPALLLDLLEKSELTAQDVAMLTAALAQKQTVEAVHCTCLEKVGSCACKHENAACA